jgi:hypothetical protein
MTQAFQLEVFIFEKRRWASIGFALRVIWILAVLFKSLLFELIPLSDYLLVFA